MSDFVSWAECAFAGYQPTRKSDDIVEVTICGEVVPIKYDETCDSGYNIADTYDFGEDQDEACGVIDAVDAIVAASKVSHPLDFDDDPPAAMVRHEYLSLPWIADELNGGIDGECVKATVLGCQTEVQRIEEESGWIDVIVTCVPEESREAIEVEVRRIIQLPKRYEPTPEEKARSKKHTDSCYAADEFLNAIIAAIPGLRYDYDRAKGHIAVPGLEKPVFTTVVLDKSAPDKIRVRSVKGSQQAVDDYVRETLGLPKICQVVANDNDVAAPPATDNPLTLDAPGGLLSEVAKFVYETSRRPIAEFSVMSAIALFSALYGRRVIGPDGTTLNLYQIMVAPPGGGKDRPLKAPLDIAMEIGRGRLIGPNDFSSDSAIERILRRDPCQLLPLDEAGLFFAASGRFSQPWERARRKALLELYSASKGRWVAKSRAKDMTEGGDEPIWWPSLSVIGATTHGNFYDGLHEEAFRDGLMARLIVIARAQKPALNRLRGHPTAPPRLVSRLKDAFAALPVRASGSLGNNLISSMKPAVYTAEWADLAAEDALYDIEKWAADVSESKESDGLIVNRASEQTMKLAMIRALSRDPAVPVVAVTDIEWGFGIVRRSHATIKRDAERYMSGSDFERLCKAIIEAVTKAGPEGIKRAELLRRAGVKQARPADTEAALKRLEETGQLDKKLMMGPGRPGVRYLPG